MASPDTTMEPFTQMSSSDLSQNVAKRKRDESVEIGKYTNGTPELQTVATSTQADDEFIRDLIDVLKVEDPSISVLKRPFPEITLSKEPQLKRQKSDMEGGPPITILSRYEAKEYKSVDGVLGDIDTLVASILDELRLEKGDVRTQYVANSKKLLKVTAFKERAHSLVVQEKAHRLSKDASNTSSKSGAASSGNKTVLTLYGNAPGPKQLFSSFQQRTALNGDDAAVVQPLQESGLPNGISTTQIISPQASGILAIDKSRVKTLGELFPAPGTLAVIQPPKPSKVATTRLNSVGWYQPTAKEPSPRAPGYLTQNIVAGQWLDYSKPLAAQDAKRRQRERALSLTSKVAEPINAETEAAKLDALFRSAYSGFAPTKDHSAAVASEGHVNRIWWQRNGEKAYGKLLVGVETPSGTIDADAEMSETLEELDIAKLEELADIDLDTIDPSLVPLGNVVKKSAEDRDTEEVLADISDLLETLNSYQRIRHMSLNASARQGGILSTTDSSGVGTPFKPSESEVLTYETLKTSLQLMIQTLPPYAVAKLNPDRLAELSISTKIEIAQEEFRGVMEEDEASARARAALAAAASRTPSTAPLHRTGSSNQMYGAQYAAQSGAGSHLYRPNTTHTPIRPPSNNYQRPPATVSAPYQARPNPVQSPAYRPPYAGPSYPQQGQGNVRQPPMQYQGAAPFPGANHQYQHPSNPPPYMRPQSQNQAYPPSAQGIPQNALNGGYPRQNFPPQTQPLQNGVNYPYNPNRIPRQSSPHKMYSPQPSPAVPRQYGTPTPTPSQGPSRPPPYMHNAMPQHQMGGATSQTPQPAFQRQPSGTHMGYSTFMTSAEQTNLLERQRAQLAQQQGMQQQARTAAQAALGSPSLPVANGTYSLGTGQ